MRKSAIVVLVFVLTLGIAGAYVLLSVKYEINEKTQAQTDSSETGFSQNEPEFELIDPQTIPVIPDQGPSPRPGFFRIRVPIPDLANWKRPEGPFKVALQVGHWRASELPDEMRRLRERGGGTSGGGKAEWEVNLAIAEATKKILEAEGLAVDIIPATVPQSYWADVFLAIHADGNTNTAASGFKAASPWRDFTGKAQKLVDALTEEYQKATRLRQDGNITRSMRGYYAFNWWRYEYAIHPMTAAAILETGFLTSPEDRKILVQDPEKAAKGISAGIIKFLNSET